jgi:thiol-disulfide isomerase/thioredoxin
MMKKFLSLFVMLAAVVAYFFTLPLDAATSPMNPTCRGPMISMGATPPIVEGGCAANATIQDSAGKPASLVAFQDKVILLHFWASWCEPCREEFPLLQKLKAKLANRSFEIVSVSIDTDHAAMQNFLKKFLPSQPKPLALLWDPQQKLSTLYGTFKVPETYIIDSHGVIRDRVVGNYPWDEGIIQHYIECLLDPHKTSVYR